MFDLDFSKQPWAIVSGLTADEFLVGMSDLGKAQEMSMVGSFADDPDDPTIRTAHRDTDLPFHRDGVYTQAIADMQGGMYVEKPNVDVVGMYCVRTNGNEPCFTTISFDGVNVRPRLEEAGSRPRPDPGLRGVGPVRDRGWPDPEA